MTGALNLTADSGDCGHGFRLNATMRSDRRRPPVPTKAAGVSLPAFGVGSDFLGCVKFGTLRSDLSHAVSIECEAVSIVDEAVEDGVGDGRITEHCRAPQSSIWWCPRSRLRTRDIPYSAASLRRCRSARHEVSPTSLYSFPTGGDARSVCRRLILASPPSHRTRRGLRCPGSACVPLSH